MPARPAGPRTGLRRPFPPRREIERYGRKIRLFMPPLFASVEAQLRRMTTLLRRSNPRPRTLYEAALFAQFLRAADTARGVITLAERGHGELALGAARVGFEQTVSAYWMALDPVSRAEQYQRFINWEDLRMIELFQTLGLPPPRPAAEVRTLVEQKRALAAEFKDARLGWTQRGLRTLCRDVGAHWKSPESLTQLARFETIATTLGNRGAHAGPRDAVHRLTRAGRFDPQLGPHEKTAAYSGFALYVTGWSFGSLAYLLARDLRVTKADAWHAFFWPLVKDVTP